MYTYLNVDPKEYEDPPQGDQVIRRANALLDYKGII